MRNVTWRLHRPLKSLRSLRTKFVLGYTLVALFAVAAISLAALITAVVSFNRFQNDQSSAQASELATQLGKAYTTHNSNLQSAALSALPATRDRPPTTLWLMD